MTSHTIVDANSVSCAVVTADWRFPLEAAAAIEENWRRRKARTPEIWNGRVLLLRDGAIATSEAGSTFRGHCFETDFKTFLAWRDAGYPDTGVRNVFSMAALESADGAFILGEMAAHTAPAGQIYFPSGTPDPSDVFEGHVDLEASARRELREETGLDPAEVAWDDGMVLVMSPIRLCCMKRGVSPDSAAVLVARIHDWLARDPKAELARIHIVRQLADINPATPDFVVAYLLSRLGREMV